MLEVMHGVVKCIALVALGFMLDRKLQDVLHSRPPSPPETVSRKDDQQGVMPLGNGTWNPKTKGWNCDCGTHWHRRIGECPKCGDTRPAPRNP